MIEWSLTYESFDPDQEKLREALYTVGNGYFCTRGATPEADADEVHYPGTYLAGGYNRLESEIHGRNIENEDLVNLPNWLPLTFRNEGGAWFNLDQVDLLHYRQELDIQNGVFSREVRFRDEQGRITSFRQRRLIHQSQRHLAGLETIVEAENWPGRLEFRSALDGRVVNNGVKRYRELSNHHLVPLETARIDEEALFLKVQMNQSELRVAMTARTRLFCQDELLCVPRRTVSEPSLIAEYFLVKMAEKVPLTVEKIVTLFTSRDEAISECGLAACKENARAGSFVELADQHRLDWKQLWTRFDIHDTEFMLFYGAEMLLEIARFWASIVTYDKKLDRYEICGVMGPDEYHDAPPPLLPASISIYRLVIQ